MSYEREPLVEQLPYFHHRIHENLLRLILKEEGDFVVRWKDRANGKGQYYVSILFCGLIDDHFIIENNPLFYFRCVKRSEVSVFKLIKLYVQESIPLTWAFGPVMIQEKDRQSWEVTVGGKVEHNMRPWPVGQGRTGSAIQGVLKEADGKERPVVLKFIGDNLSPDKMEASFKERIASLERLRALGEHPDIVQIYGYGIAIDQPTPAVVSDRVNGLNLWSGALQVPQEDTLPLRTKMQLFVKGLEIISDIHKRGYLHRDISARNFVVEMEGDNVGSLKAVGLRSIRFIGDQKSWAIDTETTNSTYPYNVQYTALEALEKLVWTVESDIWSVGIFMWEMTNYVQGGGILPTPFQGIPNFNRTVAIQHLKNGHRPKVHEELSPLIADLIRQCWDADPSKRPTIDAILTTLRPLIEGSSDAYE